jgi:hypothetical protein
MAVSRARAKFVVVVAGSWPENKKAGANEHPAVFTRAGSRVAEPPGEKPGCSFNSLSDVRSFDSWATPSRFPENRSSTNLYAPLPRQGK